MRRFISAGLLAPLGLLFVGCAFPAPMAFRLDSTGSIDIAFCMTETISSIDITVSGDAEPEATLVADSPVHLDEGVFVPVEDSPIFHMTGDDALRSDEWSTMYVSTMNGRHVGPVGRLHRGDLIEGKWVWNGKLAEGSSRSCAEPATSVLDVAVAPTPVTEPAPALIE